LHQSCYEPSETVIIIIIIIIINIISIFINIFNVA